MKDSSSYCTHIVDVIFPNLDLCVFGLVVFLIGFDPEAHLVLLCAWLLFFDRNQVPSSRFDVYTALSIVSLVGASFKRRKRLVV